MPDDRYFQPSSQTMNTTSPSSSSLAMRTAIEAIAPDETPAKMPSSSSSFRVHTIASWLVTKIFRSSSDRSMIGGMKPSSSERRPCTGSPCIGSAGAVFTPSPRPSPRRRPVALRAAPGPRSGHERGDLVELLEDLGRGAVVMRGGVRLVAVLVGHVVLRVRGGQLERHLDGAVRALRTRRVDDVRAVHLEQLRALGRDVVGHHDLHRI